MNIVGKFAHNLMNEEGADGWSHICGGTDGQTY
jgi:hypothetical protein